MPTVAELTELYTNFMLGPRVGPEVCSTCFNFTRGYDRCYACAHSEAWLAAVAPISYSVSQEQLHHALANYKRLGGEVARRLRVELAAVLWRFLADHERCIARSVGANRPTGPAAGSSSTAQADGTQPAPFPLVTTVPSGDRDRDERHPLRSIVGELVGPTRGRHERLLRRTTTYSTTHEF